MADEVANAPIHPKGDEPSSTVAVRDRRDLGGDAEWVVVIVPEGEDPHRYVPKEHVGNPIAPNYFCRGWNGKPSRMHYCSMVAGWGTDHLGSGRCKHHGGRPVTTGTRIRYDGLHHRTIGDLVRKFADDPDPLNLLADLDLARAIMVDAIERHQEFTAQMDDWHASFAHKKLPISAEDAESFRRVVDEWAITIVEDGREPTDLQIQDAARAKRYITALERPIDQGRPRKPVDILEVGRMLDTIGRLVDRLDKRDVISEAELNRMLRAMSLSVELVVTDPEQRKLIREGWMRAVTR